MKTIEEKSELAIQLIERAANEPAKLAKLLRESQARPVDGTVADGKFNRAMEALGHLQDLFELSPDSEWFHDYYLLTGEHMVLTEEGWEPGNAHAQTDPEEILDEVNG